MVLFDSDFKLGSGCLSLDDLLDFLDAFLQSDCELALWAFLDAFGEVILELFEFLNAGLDRFGDRDFFGFWGGLRSWDLGNSNARQSKQN